MGDNGGDGEGYLGGEWGGKMVRGIALYSPNPPLAVELVSGTQVESHTSGNQGEVSDLFSLQHTASHFCLTPD